MNKSHNPKNAKWYADKWDGLVNITASRRAPLFVSKAHFLDTDPFLPQQVDIFTDNTYNTPINATSVDDMWLDIEPYSGVAMGANAAFQVNAEFMKDELFNTTRYALLPVCTTIKGFNMTETQVNKIYGPLKTGLGVKKYGPIFGFIFAALFFILAIFCLCRRRSVYKKNLESLPTHDEVASYYKFDYNPAPISDGSIDYQPSSGRASETEKDQVKVNVNSTSSEPGKAEEKKEKTH